MKYNQQFQDAATQMSGFSLIIWIANSSHVSWKCYIMMYYGKTKKLLDEN